MPYHANGESSTLFQNLLSLVFIIYCPAYEKRGTYYCVCRSAHDKRRNIVRASAQIIDTGSTQSSIGTVDLHITAHLISFVPSLLRGPAAGAWSHPRTRPVSVVTLYFSLGYTPMGARLFFPRPCPWCGAHSCVRTVRLHDPIHDATRDQRH